MLFLSQIYTVQIEGLWGDTAIAVIYSPLQMHKQMQKGTKSQALNQ